MPKMKTHKGAAKRFRKTGGGHFKMKGSGTNHRMWGKESRKHKKRLGKVVLVDKTMEPKVSRLLPYA